MAITLLEMAANVRQSKTELDEICSQIRDKNGEWTGHSIAGDKALAIGTDGLSNAWTMLELLKRMAHDELARIEGVRANG